MAKTQKEFDVAVETCVDVLKDTYIHNIVYVQERIEAKAEEDELKRIEDIIISTEKLIVYFLQSDEWVKNLHAEAKGEKDGADEEGSESESEVARIEEARNS
jgi:hypothetical protein